MVVDVLKTFTVQQVAEILQLTEESILAMIHSGELPASNVNLKPDAKRPRWRIQEADLGKLLLRTRHQAAPAEPKKKRSKLAAVEEFF